MAAAKTISYDQSTGSSSSLSRLATMAPETRNANAKQMPNVWRVIGPRESSGCMPPGP